jgi:hypothetical protein
MTIIVIINENKHNIKKKQYTERAAQMVPVIPVSALCFRGIRRMLQVCRFYVWAKRKKRQTNICTIQVKFYSG